jgi:hypothetical protein
MASSVLPLRRVFWTVAGVFSGGLAEKNFSNLPGVSRYLSASASAVGDDRLCHHIGHRKLPFAAAAAPVIAKSGRRVPIDGSTAIL